MMRRNKILWQIGITGFLILVVSFIPVNSAMGAAKQMSMAVGTLGGSMGRIGAGVAEVFNRANPDAKISVVPGGGRANPERVGTGGTEFGITYSNFSILAVNGERPFKKAFPNLRGIIKFYDSFYHQYIARDVFDKGIRSWDDVVKSKDPLRIGILRKGTSSEFVNRTILGLYGLTYDDLRKRGFTLTFTGVNAASSAYQGRQLDLYCHNTAPPNGAGIQACIARPTTFMEMPKHLAEKMAKSGFLKSSIPPNMYKGQTERVDSIGSATILVTTDTIDPNIVYTLLSSMFGNKKYLSGVHKSFKALDPKESSAGMGIPLHEGAKKYYREQGVIVD